MDKDADIFRRATLEKFPDILRQVTWYITEEQALARVAQKGSDCAEVAVEMANLIREIRNEKRTA